MDNSVRTKAEIEGDTVISIMEDAAFNRTFLKWMREEQSRALTTVMSTLDDKEAERAKGAYTAISMIFERANNIIAKRDAAAQARFEQNKKRLGEEYDHRDRTS